MISHTADMFFWLLGDTHNNQSSSRKLYISKQRVNYSVMQHAQRPFAGYQIKKVRVQVTHTAGGEYARQYNLKRMLSACTVVPKSIMACRPTTATNLHATQSHSSRAKHNTSDSGY